MEIPKNPPPIQFENGMWSIYDDGHEHISPFLALKEDYGYKWKIYIGENIMLSDYLPFCHTLTGSLIIHTPYLKWVTPTRSQIILVYEEIPCLETREYGLIPIPALRKDPMRGFEQRYIIGCGWYDIEV